MDTGILRTVCNEQSGRGFLQKLFLRGKKYIGAHDEKVDDVKWSVQHFYSLDLRTYALNQICLAAFGAGRKRENDVHALKRTEASVLRQGAAKGRKSLYVWDRGGLAFSYWQKLKNCHGIYFLSRSKSNFKFKIIKA